MAGKLCRIQGACRVSTAGGAVSMTSQSGMFDAAAWVRNAAGSYSCFLGLSGGNAQNQLDSDSVVIPGVDVDASEAFSGHTIKINRTDPTNGAAFDVYISGGGEPKIGFEILIVTYG